MSAPVAVRRVDVACPTCNHPRVMIFQAPGGEQMVVDDSLWASYREGLIDGDDLVALRGLVP